MKYFVLIFIVACKLQPFSTPRDGELVVPNNTQHGVDFYLQIEDGVVLVKENDNRVVMLELHNMKLRQPQHSYAVSSDDKAQLIDGIDNVIIDSYKGEPRLFYLDEIKFSITPKASAPYVYTCTFFDVVLGKVKFQVDAGASKRQGASTSEASGCTSNHHKVAHEEIIKEKCSDYAEVNAKTDLDKLRYQSQDINDGKVFSEGDVYIYKRIHRANDLSCEQHVIFDGAAVEYIKSHALTCTSRSIKTPHMGDKFLIYACDAVDIIFFSGQAEGTLKVLSKYKVERSDDNGTYLEGLVSTIKKDGTIDFADNKAVRITTAP